MSSTQFNPSAAYPASPGIQSPGAAGLSGAGADPISFDGNDQSGRVLYANSGGPPKPPEQLTDNFLKAIVTSEVA